MPENRVAMVTGSGKQRVGARVAEALAKRGYSLVLHFHTSADEAHQGVARYTAENVAAVAIQADLADEASVRRLVDEALRRFGRIDVLVNCAAVWVPRRLEDITADDVRFHFEINTLGTFLCSQHVGLAMVRQPEGGCIVNLGDWAETRPYCNYAAYFPSKGAIPAMTRSLAVELGTRNPRVRVNCIHPGPVLLPDDISEQEEQEIVAATLVQRKGTPDHVARAVAYLIDNDFVTGDCLRVDGGRSIYARGW